MKKSELDLTLLFNSLDTQGVLQRLSSRNKQQNERIYQRFVHKKI